MSYILKYIKSDPLHLKKNLKILKLLKEYLYHLKCALHSQMFSNIQTTQTLIYRMFVLISND